MYPSLADQQVVDLGGQPITLKKIEEMMKEERKEEEKEEGSVESVEGSVESVEEQEGSVEMSAMRKKAKTDKRQTRITSFIPNMPAAPSSGSWLEWASCSSRGWGQQRSRLVEG